MSHNPKMSSSTVTPNSNKAKTKIKLQLTSAVMIKLLYATQHYMIIKTFGMCSVVAGKFLRDLCDF